MRPRPRPVTMAPMIEPIPPMTTTAKTTITRDEPIKGLTQLTSIGVPKSVTDKGMEALKKALPKAEVYRQDE